MYQVRLEQFQGPLDLLLKLCQEEKLEINKISLAKIADQYLSEINRVGVESISSSDLADFLLVAAQLLYIKSKLLLPFLEEDEEEEDAGSLEKRLLEYRCFLELSSHIKKLIARRESSFLRVGLPASWERLVPAGTVFVAKESVSGEILLKILKELLQSLEQVTVKLPKEAIRKVITLETKIKALKELLERGISLSFKKDVITGGSSKLEVVLAFLAVLELVKQQYLRVEQQEIWGEIVLNKYDQS